MALTLEQQHLLATEAAFRDRIAMAFAGYADNVMAENQSGMTGVDHNGVTEAAARTALAAGVIRNAIGVADSRKWWLAAQASGLNWPGSAFTLATVTITDAQYNAFISANWSVLAGWRAAP